VKPVDVSALALSDLLAIANWLVDYASAKRANQFIDDFESVLEDLRRFPELGPLDINDRTRILRRGGYRFRYVIGQDRLTLLRITDPRRG
jgi:plasmid stabilization system protein ParE